MTRIQRGCGPVLTYVDNLDRSTERMVFMSDQLSRLGVPFERVPAIDGHTLDPGYVAKFKPMVATMVANYLTHKSMWQRIADSGDRYGIIVEDDIHIAPNYAQFALSTEWIPPDAGIVKFETLLWPVEMDEEAQGTWYGAAVHRLRTFHPGAAAYMLSADAARFLLETCAEPRESPGDAMFYADEPWRHLPPIYQIDPAPCIQDMIIRSQPKGPRLLSVMEFKRRRPKPLGHRAQREARKLYRRVSGLAAPLAVALGARPPFIKKIVTFAGEVNPSVPK